MLRVFASTVAAALLAGCSTTFKPSSIDPATGLYATSSKVDPGGVLASKDRVNLGDYSAVLLVVDSNSYPPRLEFVARKALMEMGFKNVVDVAEFRRWAADNQVDVPSELNLLTVQKFSTTVKPVLLVEMTYYLTGGAHQFGGIKVIDGRSGSPLLTVRHSKTVWMNTDDEIILPVLNELRRWCRDVGRQTA